MSCIQESSTSNERMNAQMKAWMSVPLFRKIAFEQLKIDKYEDMASTSMG